MSNLDGITARALDGAAAVGSGAALVAVSQDGTVTFASDAFLAAAGVAGDAVGLPLSEVIPGLVPPGGTVAAAAGQGAAVAVDWAWAGPHGWIGTIAPAPGAAPSAAPRRDALTGLPDRAALAATFEAIRAGAGAPDVVAACVDLDRFKAVNDSLGHAAGDDLLRKVAKRLVASLRAGDAAIRMGGDEFVLLLPDCDAAAAEAMARRVVDVLGRPFVVHGHQVIVGASVGLARLDPGEAGVDGLLRRADVALYRSKQSGRGCVSWFEPGMFAALDERRTLEADLRKALLLEEFALAYQSQFDFGRAAVTGFEALIRWNHPARGLVSPAAFIPVAEETGAILAIGAWVLREACRAATAWPAGLHVAVNVSPVQFTADGFVESVRTALDASGLAPGRLELELTESVLLTDDALVLDLMRDLRTLGVRLSLDDFGTGYSSLNYLRKYPFDKVKIDQSFVREPLADETAHRIVTAVAGLGAAMGMSVIAEGVETEAQLDRIRAQGCSAAQGYLLSRPIPEAAIAAYLDAARRAASADPATPDEEPTRC